MVKNCRQCGKTFEGHARRLYCCDKCSRLFQVKLNKARIINKVTVTPEPVPEAAPRPLVNPDTIRMNEEAKKLGMSYGQYDAYLRSIKDREERERRKRGL